MTGTPRQEHSINGIRPPSSFSAPAFTGFAITPSDSAAFGLTRWVYVGGAGDLKVTMAMGDPITLKAVPAGTLLPISVTQVLATGTTATNIAGLA